MALEFLQIGRFRPTPFKDRCAIHLPGRMVKWLRSARFLPISTAIQGVVPGRSSYMFRILRECPPVSGKERGDTPER